MPEPSYLFEPHMPEVDVLPDMQGVFAKARIEIASGGERRVGIVHRGESMHKRRRPECRFARITDIYI